MTRNFVLFFLIIFIFFPTKLKAKNCLSFLPYAFNEHYVHLPQNKVFCVKNFKKTISYKTDRYGARILNNFTKDNIQVFGDSQVLGLDINYKKNHFLNNLYNNKNFLIYAAPNNGPYEVINFLNKNKKILKKKIIVTFNFSTDLFRVSSDWEPKNFVALRDYELDNILESPFKYKFIIFKNFLINKNFTLATYNNKKMQNFFLNSDHNELNKNLVNYFKELNIFADDNNLEITFIAIQPYWIYSINKKKNHLIFEKKLSKQIISLICNSFQVTKNISRIYISKEKHNLSIDALTFDRRHLKSDKIILEDFKNYCS